MRTDEYQKASRPSFFSPSERKEYDRVLNLYKAKRPARTVHRCVAKMLMRLGVPMKLDGVGWEIIY